MLGASGLYDYMFNSDGMIRKRNKMTVLDEAVLLDLSQKTLL